MATVDLNADMGESYGPWKMGNDDILLDIVTSANIACGFHAGDPNIMLSTMKMAAEKDVGIGAHPGFHDIEGLAEIVCPFQLAPCKTRCAIRWVRHWVWRAQREQQYGTSNCMGPCPIWRLRMQTWPMPYMMPPCRSRRGDNYGLAATAHQEAAEKLDANGLAKFLPIVRIMMTRRWLIVVCPVL